MSHSAITAVGGGLKGTLPNPLVVSEELSLRLAASIFGARSTTAQAGTATSTTTTKYTRGAEFVNSGFAVAAPANDVLIECPVTGTIQSATLLTTGGPGSCVVDIWKTTYAAAPPTVTNTICGSNKPTITSSTKSKDTTLSGWTTAITAGDVLTFHLVSSSTFTAVSIILEIA